MKILHISDLHFHKDQENNKAANRLLKTINNKFPNHYLVVTGDITDDGHKEQYQNALEALKPFVGRIFIVPGNHDDGTIGNLYSLKKANRFDAYLSGPLNQRGFFAGDNLPVVNVVDDIKFIALDSNLETENPFDFACGRIGKQQLEVLDTILNKNPDDRKTVLFCHHHPFIRNDPFIKMQDANEFARIIYGRVDILLFGHRHVMESWQGRWRIKHIAASDNSPGKNRVGEIIIENDKIQMNYVEV